MADTERIARERHELLERLRDDLLEAMIACETAEPENEGEPEILMAVLDETGEENEREGAVGEFFFLPVKSGEEEVQYFSTVITLADDIQNENLPALYEAMSYINFGLPCGGYCIDSDKSFLAYKLTVPLPIGLEGEALYEQINICVGNAVHSADQFSDILLKISAGEADVDDILIRSYETDDMTDRA